jgi:squalene-hopene/tetraprenyl-beta-curcumene cyclase
MPLRWTAIFLSCLPVFCADWNPKLAADFMDSRQKAWFAWPRANNAANGVCLSCHTGLPYLLARPALRSALKEGAPTAYESGLLDAVRKRLATAPLEFDAAAKASPGAGTEPVLAALLLASEDARSASGKGALSKETERAFGRLWALQISGGDSKGAWTWASFDLDPYEEPYSMFYGAALAALAVGVAPSGYQSRPGIRSNVEALQTYLAAQQKTQPLHNRLALVWASTKLKGTLSQAERKAIAEEVLRAQQADGGWTIESLGAWSRHPDAPPSAGSNAYATGMVAFILQQAGVSRTNPGLVRALNWLRSSQDSGSGFWDAQSMNKRYEPDSMQSQFMRDAATGYASLALLASESK